MNAHSIPLRALLAACLFGVAGAALAQAPAPAIVTVTDKPLRVIRGAAVYKAPGGTVLQPGDIVETGAGSAQVEAGPDAIIAMGPNTRLYVESLAGGGKGTELQLLQGWVKLASKGPARAGVALPGFHAGFARGAMIAGSKPGKDAVFADEGEHQLVRSDDKGKPGAPLKLPSEQFAFALAGQPLVVQARPGKDFRTEMPLQFRDRLAPAPASVRAPKTAAVRERDVDLADVAPWLAASLPARKGFVARFKVRLKDPVFRKELEQALPGPEWKAVLAPKAAPAEQAAEKAPEKPHVPRNQTQIY